MIISGDNACLACLIHNPSKVKEVLINKDKKADYMKIIEKNNIDVDLLIADEAHKLRNETSQLNNIIGKIKIEARLVKLVDTTDLKSVSFLDYWFKSGSE